MCGKLYWGAARPFAIFHQLSKAAWEKGEHVAHSDQKILDNTPLNWQPFPSGYKCLSLSFALK